MKGDRYKEEKIYPFIGIIVMIVIMVILIFMCILTTPKKESKLIKKVKMDFELCIKGLNKAFVSFFE